MQQSSINRNGPTSRTGKTAKLCKIVPRFIRHHLITKRTKLQVLILGVVIGLLLSLFIYAISDKPKYVYIPKEHFVTANDSLGLDSIAAQYCPEFVSWEDYRNWVREHNRTEDGYIYPGDTVVVADVVEV